MPAGLSPRCRRRTYPCWSIWRRWENLRKTPAPHEEAGAAFEDLQGRQKFYEAFRVKLVAYNDRHSPAHLPELLLNTPIRLGTWCRKMRDLLLQVEQGAAGPLPGHLLEKAYRWPDRIGTRFAQTPRDVHGAPGHHWRGDPRFGSRGPVVR